MLMLQELLEHVVTALLLLKNRLPCSDARNVSTSATATESGLWEPAFLVDRSRRLHFTGREGPQRSEPAAESIRLLGSAWPALPAGAADPVRLELELERIREQVLNATATMSLQARRITVHLGAAADKWWPTLLKGLPKLTALS